MTPSKDVSRLIEIMAALRDPDGGCPWDVEQTFASIAPYTIEEAYEVADAIERADPIDLKEELGDLLLQVVYHSQLAAEAGHFTFEDVVEAITRKMIRRHPHVFGDAQARSAGAAKGQWERIKAEEKAEKRAARATMPASRGLDGRRAVSDAETFLGSVPPTGAALSQAQAVQKRAATVGFDWADEAPIRAKIAEEYEEFDRVLADGGDPAALTDEMGDCLFSLVNLARFHDIDAETALRGTVRKFRDRFATIERSLAEDGRSLSDASLDEMEARWVAAKTGTA